MSEALSERATGMLKEVVNIMEKVEADCRRAVFGRRLLTLAPIAAVETGRRGLFPARSLRW